MVNDAELLVPAAGLRDGIGVIAGTGSIAVARRADGTMLVAGGWGWILGDEGSAPGLVREAARAVRNAIDVDDETDCLYDMLRRSIGAARALVVLVERVVTRGAPSGEVVVSGGVMVGQPVFQDLFRQELGSRLPDAHLSILTEPPVAGAVALAAQLLESTSEAGAHGPAPASAQGRS